VDAKTRLSSATAVLGVVEGSPSRREKPFSPELMAARWSLDEVTFGHRVPCSTARFRHFLRAVANMPGPTSSTPRFQALEKASGASEKVADRCRAISSKIAGSFIGFMARFL